MALFIRVYPSRLQYRLPAGEDAAEVTKALAEVIGSPACMVLGYELPDVPRSNPVVILNGNVVECVELIDVPDEPTGG